MAANAMDATDTPPTALPPDGSRPHAGEEAAVVREMGSSRGWRGWIFTGLLGVWLVCFLLMTRQYWAAAHAGTDQNAYLVAAKLLAETGSPCLRPTGLEGEKTDPFQYVGLMWVGPREGSEPQSYDPKYPAGVWTIYAGVIRVAGRQAVYYVSAACMLVGLGVSYLFMRRFAGSAAALAGVMVLSLSGSMLEMTNSPNSHAMSLVLSVTAMYGLTRWVWRGGWISAAATGLLAGVAVSVRYTDGLLLLPMLAGVVIRVVAPPTPTTRRGRAVAQGLVMLAVWAVPVGALAGYNLGTFGSLTGYDATEESTQFAWAHLARNATTYLWLVGQVALPGVSLLSLAGLGVMFARRWRLGVLMGLWIVPTLGVSMAYYFDPNPRFFLSAMPGMVLCAVWLAAWPVTLSGAGRADAASRALSGVVLGLLAAAMLLTLPMALGAMGRDRDEWRNIETRAEMVMNAAPAGSLLFADEPSMSVNLLNHLQFVGDYRLYRQQAFTPYRLLGAESPERLWLTRARVEALERQSAEMTPVRMAEARHKLAREAVAAGRRVFVISGDESGLSVRRAFPPGGFLVEERAVVEDPSPTTGWRLRGEGWREHVGQRMRWHLYEVAPSATSAPASRATDG